mmetsp:Transcript_1556/g.4577  ORF Transcript_1556/g.4577 Transcript_1556/m.4577 type:complete len:218 (+) Transcript_1556:250-903(+)
MGRDSTRGRLDRRTARSGPDRHGASARAKFRGVRKPIAARPGRLWHGASGGRAAGQVRWAPVSSAVLPLSLSARLTAPEGALRTTSAAARTRRPRACKPCQAFICAGPERAFTVPVLRSIKRKPHAALLFVATLVAALPTPRRRVRAPSRIRSSPRGGGGRIADSRSTTLPRDSRSTILPRGAAAIASSRSRSSRRRRASTAALTKTQENRITQARY